MGAKLTWTSRRVVMSYLLELQVLKVLNKQQINSTTDSDWFDTKRRIVHQKHEAYRHYETGPKGITFKHVGDLMGISKHQARTGHDDTERAVYYTERSRDPETGKWSSKKPDMTAEIFLFMDILDCFDKPKDYTGPDTNFANDYPKLRALNPLLDPTDVIKYKYLLMNDAYELCLTNDLTVADEFAGGGGLTQIDLDTLMCWSGLDWESIPLYTPGKRARLQRALAKKK